MKMSKAIPSLEINLGQQGSRAIALKIHFVMQRVQCVFRITGIAAESKKYA